jgi:hypothetical protein
VKIILHDNLDKLGDLAGMYEMLPTLQKQQFLSKVFDNQLYYQDKIYRTTYLMPVFSHNLLVLTEKKLLVVETKTGFSKKTLSGADDRNRTYMPCGARS